MPMIFYRCRMVKMYKRKTNSGEWSEGNMDNAVESETQGTMGYYRASKSYGIIQTTLNWSWEKYGREFLTCNWNECEIGPESGVSYKEKELCNYILDMESTS